MQINIIPHTPAQLYSFKGVIWWTTSETRQTQSGDFTTVKICFDVSNTVDGTTYTNHLIVSFSGNRANDAAQFQQGQEVVVTFRIKGRAGTSSATNKPYAFADIQGWSIQPAPAAPPATNANTPPPYDTDVQADNDGMCF